MDAPSTAIRLNRVHYFLPVLARLINATSVLLSGGEVDSAVQQRVGVLLRPKPVVLPSDGAPCGVACGAGFTAAWTDAGDAFLFGANAYGQCGNKKFTEAVPLPEKLHVDARHGGVESIALGFQHGVALARDGTLWAWGKNNNGQLGFGDRETASVPRLVPLPDAVVQVVSGLSHCAALTDCGDVWVWGKMRSQKNTYHPWPSKEIHVHEDALKPRLLDPAPGAYGPNGKVRKIAASNFHVVATNGDRVFVSGFEHKTRRMASEWRECDMSNQPPPSSKGWRLRCGIEHVALFDETRAYQPFLEAEKVTPRSLPHLEPPRGEG